ncbi:hypothetical protein JKA74_08620 [Marivirga sp. S37H4]|uniref:Uncharacterized protein n=1 Tax=Marivirga aurantiaca TaxID=2802615 RepID=A0A934WY18_9BACT|nr:hypothetical protein [Marivirga aurantiaca]MBK6265099.1 hypothetical protein [Marivirga aurantiaca]
MENEKIESMDNISHCFEILIAKNLELILEDHHVKSISEIDANEMGQRIQGRLVKNCKYAYELMIKDQPKQPVLKEHLPESQLNCSEVHTGDFYYLTPDQEINKRDTTFVTFTENEYLERMKLGRTYSKLELNWLDDCRFELTFIESNDPFKSSLSKSGDKYEYKIIDNNKNSIILSLWVNEKEYQIEYFKIQ